VAQKQCPKCERLWGEDEHFCGLCGTRLITLKSDEPEEEEEPESAARAALLWFLEVFPGFARPMVLMASIAMFVLALIAFALTFMMLGFQVYITAVFVGSGGVVIYWTAFSWMMYGYVCTPVEAMSEFRGVHWFVLLLATLIPGGLFLLLCQLATAASERGH